VTAETRGEKARVKRMRDPLDVGCTVDVAPPLFPEGEIITVPITNALIAYRSRERRGQLTRR
jgi:hypothetical protein